MLRMQWLDPESYVLEGLREEAGTFLQEAVTLPCVVNTSPDRAQTIQQLRARFGP